MALIGFLWAGSREEGDLPGRTNPTTPNADPTPPTCISLSFPYSDSSPETIIGDLCFQAGGRVDRMVPNKATWTSHAEFNVKLNLAIMDGGGFNKFYIIQVRT